MILRYSTPRRRLLTCWLPLALGVHATEPLLEDAATGRDLPLWVSDEGVLGEDDTAAPTSETETLRLQDLAAEAERRQRTLALLALDQGVDRADADEPLPARPETGAAANSDDKAQAPREDKAGMYADTHVQAEVAKATKVANFLASDAKELSKQLKLIRGPLFRRLNGGEKKPRQAQEHEQEAPRKTEGAVREGAGREVDDEEVIEAEGDGGGDKSYVHEDADRVEPVSREVKEQSVSLMAKRPRLPDPEDSLQLTDEDKEEDDDDLEDGDSTPRASFVGKGEKLHEHAVQKGPKGRKKDSDALPRGLPVDDLEPFGVNGLSAISAGRRQEPQEEDEEPPAAEGSDDESIVEPEKAPNRVDERALQPDGDGDGGGDHHGHHHGHHGGDGGSPKEEGKHAGHKTSSSTAMKALHVVILVLVIAFLILWVYHVRRRLNEAAAAKLAEEEKRKKDEEEGKVDPAAADGEKKEGGEEGEKKGKFGFLKK